MEDFVNKIKKGETEYEIRDTRIENPSVEDAGKVLKVGDDGAFELGQAGGGTKLYLHQLDITSLPGSIDCYFADGTAKSITPTKMAIFAITNSSEPYTVSKSAQTFISGYLQLKYTSTYGMPTSTYFNIINIFSSQYQIELNYVYTCGAQGNLDGHKAYSIVYNPSLTDFTDTVTEL